MTRKIKVVFIASILLNVLLLGMVGGHMLKRWSYHQDRQAQRAELLQDLPKESAEKIEAMLDSMFRSHRGNHKQVKDLRQESIALLAAEPFDRNAYQQQMEQMHQLRGDRMRDFAKEIADMAEILPQNERKVLAELLRHPPHKRHCKSKK